MKAESLRLKVKIVVLALCFLSGDANASDVSGPRWVIKDKLNDVEIPVNVNDPKTKPNFHATIQSTSVNWEAVSGLWLREYRLRFTDIGGRGKSGLEVYYLDAFPCYGSGQNVFVWMNSKTTDASVDMICLRRPQDVKFAYRAAKKGASQAKTEGIITCKVEKNLTVKIDNCEEMSWKDFQNDETE